MNLKESHTQLDPLIHVTQSMIDFLQLNGSHIRNTLQHTICWQVSGRNTAEHAEKEKKNYTHLWAIRSNHRVQQKQSQMRADLAGNYIQSKLLLSLKHVDKTKPYYQSIQLYNYIVSTETDKVQLLKLFILSSASCVLRAELWN